MNFWKSNEVIEMTVRWIRNNLILKRDWKSKLCKTSLQLKRKWMKETFKQTKMNWNHLYIMIFWSESLKIAIVANKKMLIRQHNLNIFTLKQRVYLNDSDSRDDVTAIVMRMNWELNKRLKESTLVITYHDELKELIARAKHLIDVATANQECHEKTYKVYSDSQIFLKTVKVMTSTKDQTRLQQVQIAHENIQFQEVTLKLHWMTEYTEMFENEAANKMIDNAHELSLLLIEHQRIEMMTWLTLIQKQIRQTWRIVWRKKFNAAHFWYLTSKMTHQHLHLHRDYAKSHNALLTQLCTRKIDFNQFLHERWVFNVTMTMCKCDRDQMLIKHILLTCSKWKIEWKMMQCKENITNLRKLLEIMSVMTTIIWMILLTSILNQFQTVTSLKNQMKERESREKTSS